MRWRPCKSGRNDTFIATCERLLKAVGARRLRTDDNANPSAIWKFLDLMAERSTCASIVRVTLAVESETPPFGRGAVGRSDCARSSEGGPLSGGSSSYFGDDVLAVHEIKPTSGAVLAPVSKSLPRI